MTTYYHVAPAAAVEDILANGILPLIKQFRGDEDAALDAWMARWAARMGRDVEEIEALSVDARADLNRVCVFQSLVVAKAWADAEADMVVIAINDEDDFLADDLRADYNAADGEEGALYMTYEIDPEYLEVVA